VDWNAIGAIGEVVGAIAVIVTLVYLAAQIRQNTASIRSSTQQAISEASASLQDLLASDAGLGRIFATGVADLKALTPEERMRFQFIMMAFLRRAENVQRQSSQNRVPPEEWTGLRTSLLWVMSQPGARRWWGQNSRWFNPRFSDWLDEHLDDRSD
jgi:hypothetical protein